jgi:hypothetical protein
MLDWLEEVVEGDLEQRLLHVAVRDDVDRDIDVPGLAHDFGHEVVDGALVERVDDRSLGETARRANIGSDTVEHFLFATGQEESGALAREGAGYRPADRAGSSVDYGYFGVE